jgi:hypothetical protein
MAHIYMYTNIYEFYYFCYYYMYHESVRVNKTGAKQEQKKKDMICKKEKEKRPLYLFLAELESFGTTGLAPIGRFG